MKKFLTLALVFLLVLTGCGSNNNGGNEEAGNESPAKEGSTKAEGTIAVISREDGSGTRSAFVEITGVEKKNDAGEKEDRTYIDAVVQNSTEGVTKSVSGNDKAIGYISLGSLNDTVKAVKVEGVEATPENIVAGEYKVARPFNIVYKELSPLGEDFIKFLGSPEAAEIINEEGYIANEETTEYKPANMSGNLSITGSTSVSPLMEVLVEKYKELNPGFSADIQSVGSSAGVKAVMDGGSEIGMASRAIKEEEDVEEYVLCMDGIAIIVNNDNPVDDLTLEQIEKIFIGEITKWEEL